MKKIFLTSGIIVCMACPAFATGFNTDPYDADPQELTQTGACVENVLGVDHGSTVLQAKWTPKIGEIDLTSGYTFTRTQCTDSALNVEVTHTPGVNDAADPDPLYAVYNTAVYGSSQDATDGTNAITQLTQTPVITGYTFGGYYASTDTSFAGTKYIDENGDFDNGLKNYNNGAGGSLIAKWTADEYTDAITYNCGTAGSTNVSVKEVSGVAADLTQDTTYDQCYALADPTNKCDTPTGYAFGGWNCTKGGAAFNMPGATKTLGADAQQNALYYAAGAGGVWTEVLGANETVTCTAIWTAEDITITWFDNGATTPHTGGSNNCSYGGPVTLPSAPSKTGYDFDGWEYIDCSAAANADAAACQTQSGNNNG